MSAEADLARFSPDKETLLAIGVFDGVHLGHKHLISQLVKQAKERGLMSGVVTFRQHPEEVLYPQSEVAFLTSLAERSKLLKDEGVDIVVPLSFTSKLARLSAPEFVNLLQKHLRMRGLVIGADFALGRNREGGADALRRLGEELDFSVTVVPPVVLDGEIVSSTAIRKALAEGNVKKVSNLTGRIFSLRGCVVSGAGRGVALGFPTANLEINQGQAVPVDGVYATRAYVNERTYQAMAYIGKNPTFGGSKRGLEVHLLDYHGDLRGRELRVDMVGRLRGEKRFNSTEELKRQIAEDVEKGRAILNSGGIN